MKTTANRRRRCLSASPGEGIHRIAACILIAFSIVSSPRPLFCQEDREQHRPPNILLVLTDDQGWPTLGCYGGKIVPTPNLDRLAGEGARFTDAYVTSQCTPTRATLLTGQYTARHGLWHVLSWYGYPWARMTEPAFAENFPRETFTLAKGLRAAGYVTGIMGKWHLTSNQDGDYRGLRPEASRHYGFDYAPPLLTNDEFKEGADRGVDILTDQAIAFIKDNRASPWFCYLSHHMIHGVVVAPESLTDKYRRQGYGNEGPNRAVYLAGLEHIDRSIGRLMRALEELGEADETLVIFLSDNGGIDERYGFQQLPRPNPPTPKFRPDVREYDNAPLRAGKGSIYEGGVRVPMIVRWPAGMARGQVIDTPVHAVDILPTALAAAGGKAPGDVALDGENLLPLMAGGDGAHLVNRPIYQYYPFYDLRWGLTPSASIRQGDYKLIEFFGDRVDAEGRYRPQGRVELYNLARDLGETRNLAASDDERAAELRGRLHQWLADLGAEASAPNAHHDADRALVETRDKPAWLKP
ncbi:MAG: sulfatase [Pirellulaceae bacterium]